MYFLHILVIPSISFEQVELILVAMIADSIRFFDEFLNLNLTKTKANEPLSI